MTHEILLQHERVDDIPLLIGLMQQLHLPELMERHLGSHHLHEGLSNGWLACVWMSFILSQANHCKVSVRDWAESHQHTLETLCGQALRDVEFSDDRLSIVLWRLAEADWSALEKTCGLPPVKFTRLCPRAFAWTLRLPMEIGRAHV